MQACEIDVRNRRTAPISAHGAVEHPCRDFKKSVRRRTRKAAAENMCPFGQRLIDVNEPPGPGMPRIQKLANLGPVGVLSSRCVTSSGHTARSAPRRAERFNPGKFQLPLAQNRGALQPGEQTNLKPRTFQGSTSVPLQPLLVERRAISAVARTIEGVLSLVTTFEAARCRRPFPDEPMRPVNAYMFLVSEVVLAMVRRRSFGASRKIGGQSKLRRFRQR